MPMARPGAGQLPASVLPALRSDWKPLLSLLVLTLFAHFQLLLADGVVWDDVLVHRIAERGDYEELYRWMMEMGLPINYLFFRSFLGLFGYASHYTLSLFFIYASAAVIYFFVSRRLEWGRGEGVVFASLFIACMPFRSTPLVTTLQYQFGLLMFLAGALMCEKRFDTRGWRWALPGSVCFLFAFNTASFLVFFYFYLWVSLCLHLGRREAGWAGFASWLRHSWALALLAPAYFAAKLVFFPTYGPYANYNKINLSPAAFRIARYFHESLWIYDPVLLMRRYGNKLPWLIIPIAVLVLLLFRLNSHRGARLGRIHWSVPVLAVVCAILPYAVVGQGPRPMFWESRHLLLFCITLPLLFYYLAHLPLRLPGLHLREPMAIVSQLFLACVVACYLILGLVNYYVMQLGAIKQHAIVQALRGREDLKRMDYFAVVDNVGHFSASEAPLYEANHENYYSWAYLFTTAWGDDRWFAYSADEFGKDKVNPSARYGTAHVNPNGAWCTIEMHPSSQRTAWKIYREYTLLKLSGERLDPFLGSLITISPCKDGKRDGAG